MDIFIVRRASTSPEVVQDPVRTVAEKFAKNKKEIVDLIQSLFIFVRTSLVEGISEIYFIKPSFLCASRRLLIDTVVEKTLNSSRSKRRFEL